jgi:carbon storage regulator
MLVLTRKNGETVCISDRIEVKVLSISRNSVKLGFSAPPQVNICRQEIMHAPQKRASNERRTSPPLKDYPYLAVCSVPLPR